MAHTVHHDERVPERTTPQGSQAEGVEFGHEGRDIDLGSVLGWFAGTAIAVLVSIAVLWGVFKVWAATATRNDVLPSRLFATSPPPPLPRIMPNPRDSGLNPRETTPADPRTDYPETLPQERAREEQELRRLGITNPTTGLPQIPPQAMAKVLTAAQKAAGEQTPVEASPQAGGPGQPPASNGLEQLMPSGPSGGTRVEDRLH